MAKKKVKSRVKGKRGKVKGKRGKVKGKKTVKKIARKKEKIIGKISHYYDKISVAAIKLTAPIKVGDLVNIKGHTTDFKQKIDSMQINHINVLKAKKGDEIGIKVKEYVRDGDKIYPAKEVKPAPKNAYQPPVDTRPTLFKPMLPIKKWTPPQPSAAKPAAAAPPPQKTEAKPAAQKMEPKKDYSQIKFLGF